MRLASISLKPLYVSDTSEKIDGVLVWQPYGWFAHTILDCVTGPQLAELEDLMRYTRSVRYMDGKRQAYDYKTERAWVELYDRELIDTFVRGGALRKPEVMLELGRQLFANLEAQLQERRA